MDMRNSTFLKTLMAQDNFDAATGLQLTTRLELL